MDPCDHCEEVMQPFLDRSLSREEQVRSRRTSRLPVVPRRFRFEQELRGYVRVACTEGCRRAQGTSSRHLRHRRCPSEIFATAPRARPDDHDEPLPVVAARERSGPDAELAREPLCDVVAATLVVDGGLRVVEAVRATYARDVVPSAPMRDATWRV